MLRNLNIIHILNFIVATVFIVAAIAVIVVVNFFLHQDALNRAETVASAILDERLSIHRYFNSDLKPEIFKLVNGKFDEDYFDPIWMSSTFAIRNIHRYFSYMNNENYYYKEAAINARNPGNEADVYEHEFLKALNAGSSETRKSEIRKINGEPFFQTIQKGETMEEQCLYCHSTPEKAPTGLVKIYGSERSFSRHNGEIVSAVSIRIPLSEAYSRADSISLGISIFLTVMLSGIYAIQFWLSRGLIYSPITRMARLASEISVDPKKLGEQIEVKSGKEFMQLAESFNTMSTSLRRNTLGLEEIINSRTKELSGAVKDLESFAYTVSHDIKNPIRRIMSYSQIMEDTLKDRLDDESAKFLSNITENSHKAMLLVDSILQLSRIHRSKLFLMEVNLSRIVRDVFEGMKSTEPERNIIIKIESGITAKADKNLMSVLFENLVGNAWKFTSNIDDAIIEFGWRTIDDESVYFVRDNGIGFDQKHADVIFEPFQRLHTDAEFKGTGIGLSTVKKIVTLHKGRIWAESAPGKGAAFFFTLNAVDCHYIEAAQDSPEMPTNKHGNPQD